MNGATLVRLAKRFLTRAAWIRGFALVSLPFALMLGVLAGIDAIPLSTGQLIDRDIQGFDAVSTVGSVSGRDQVATRSVVAAIEARALPTASAVELFSIGLKPDFAERTYNYQWIESDWTNARLQHATVLIAGRQPASPGEVSVSEKTASKAPVGSVMSLASGNVRLNVVGSYRPRYGQYDGALHVAQGTWETLPFDALHDRGFQLTARANLYTAGANTTTIAAVLSEEKTRSGNTDFDSAATPVITSQTIRNTNSTPFSQRRPLMGVGPAMLSAIVCAYGYFLLRARWARRQLGILRAIGINARLATAAIFGGGTAIVFVSATVGIVMGFGSRVAGRTIARTIAGHEIGPSTSMMRGASIGLIGLTIGTLLAGVSTHWTHRNNDVNSLFSPARPKPGITITAIIAILVAARYSIGVDSAIGVVDQSIRLILAIIVIAIALLILTMPRLGKGAGRLPVTQRLAARRISNSYATSITLCAVLLVSLGPVAGAVVISRVADVSNRNGWDYGLHADQLAVPTGPSFEPATLIDALNDAMPLHAVPVAIATQRNGDHTLAWTASGAGRVGPLRIVADVAAAKQILGSYLTKEGEQTLLNGGLVTSHKLSPNPRLELIDYEQPTAPIRSSPPLPVTRFEPDRAWSNHGAGIILAATATRLEIKSQLEMYVYSNVNDFDAARNKLVTEGFNLDRLSYRRDYQGPPISQAANLARLLLLAVFALMVVVTTSAQVHLLRNDSRTLLTIGVPPQQARAVLRWQMGILVGTGLLLGLGTGLVAIGLITARTPGLQLSIPWFQFATTTAATVVLTATATEIGSRRLTTSAPSKKISNRPRLIRL
jgi:hypothetical protein